MEKVTATAHGMPEVLWMAGRGSGLLALFLSPDGRQLMGIGHALYFWRVSNLQLLRVLNLDKLEVSHTTKFQLSPDGRRLGVMTPYRCAAVYDLASGKLICYRELESHESIRLDVASDSPRGVVVRYEKGYYAEVFDLISGQVLLQIPNIHHVATISPDGRYLFGWTEQLGDRFCVWRLTAQGVELVKTREKMWFSSTYSRLAPRFSPKGTYLIFKPELYQVVIWDMNQLEERVLQTTATPVAISDDGRYAALHPAQSWERSIEVVEVATGKKVAEIKPSSFSREWRDVMHCVFLPGNAEIACIVRTAGSGISRLGRFSLAVYDSRTGQMRLPDGHATMINDIDIRRDGNAMLSTEQEEGLREWCLNTMQSRAIQVIQGRKPDSNSVFPPLWAKYLSDRRRLVLVHSDGLPGIWDPLTDRWTPLQHPRVGTIVLASALSPDKRWFATAGAYLRIWDLRTGKLHLDTSIPYPGAGLAFSPDSRWLATGSCPAKEAFLFPSCVGGRGEVSPTILLWDVVQGKKIREWGEHQGGVSALAFSPNGRWLASGDATGVVTIWRMPDWRLQSTFKLPAYHPLFPSSRNMVLALAFSPDGRWLAAGGWGALILWDMGSQNLRHVVPTGIVGVSAIQFLPDGRRFVYGRTDGVLILARVPA